MLNDVLSDSCRGIALVVKAHLLANSATVAEVALFLAPRALLILGVDELHDTVSVGESPPLLPPVVTAMCVALGTVVTACVKSFVVFEAFAVQVAVPHVNLHVVLVAQDVRDPTNKVVGAIIVVSFPGRSGVGKDDHHLVSF